MKPYFTLTAPHATDNGWPPGAVGVEVGYVLTRSDLEASARGEPPRHAARELPHADRFEMHCAERVAARTDPAIAEYVGAEWLPLLLDACTDRSREGIESIAQIVTTRALGDEGGESAVRILSNAILGVCRGASRAALSDPETFITELRKRADEVHAGEGLSAYVTAQHFTPTVLHAVGLDEGYQWHRPVLRFEWLYRLACAVWEGDAAAEWKRERNRRAAIPAAVAAEGLDLLLSPQIDLTFEGEEGRIYRAGKQGKRDPVATYDPDARDLINQHLGAFGTVTGHRLLRHLIHGAHRQWVRDQPEFRIVRFEGGYSGVAKAIGGTSKEDAETVKHLLEVGAKLHIKSALFDMPDGLWSRTILKHGRRRILDVEVSRLLAPEAHHLIEGKTGSANRQRGRRLVPELRKEPPTKAKGIRRRDRGAIWSLQRLLLIEMVALRKELFREDSIGVSALRWRQLAARAGLPANALNRVLDLWAEGESEQAPQLVERQGDRFTLASPHAAELDFIREGARIQIGGQKRRQGGSKRKRSKG